MQHPAKHTIAERLTRKVWVSLISVALVSSVLAGGFVWSLSSSRQLGARLEESHQRQVLLNEALLLTAKVEASAPAVSSALQREASALAERMRASAPTDDQAAETWARLSDQLSEGALSAALRDEAQDGAGVHAALAALAAHNPVLSSTTLEIERDLSGRLRLLTAASAVSGLALIALTLFWAWTLFPLTRRLAQDLKQQAAAERALRDFQSTLDVTRDCVFIFDAQTLRFTYVNQGAVTQVGYTREELLEMGPIDLKPLYDEARFRALLAPLESGKQAAMIFDTQHRTKGGEDLPVEISLQLVQRPDASPQYIAIVRESGDRLALFSKLRASEEHLAKAQAIAHIGSWQWDMVTGALNWTDEHFRICGLEPGSVEPSYELFLESVHPDDRDSVGINVERALESGAYQNEHRLLLPDGSVRHVLAQGQVEYAPDDGRPWRMRGTIQDISARQAYEEGLREVTRRAEEAAAAKSLFLANMSHEIRTPMNGVLGMLELLRGTRLERDQAHFVNQAIHSAELQLAVINDILDFSKIEAGKMSLEHTAFQVSQIYEDVAAVTARQAWGKGIEFRGLVDPALPWELIGDPTRLRQILTNLCSNAVKFTSRGEIELRLELSSQEHSSVEVMATVRDTGIGIAPEGMTRLFQPFSQGDSSTTRRFGGTGLGLAICDQLATAMGGAIEVESAEGGGTTFRVRLPFELDPQQRAPRPQNFEGTSVLVAEPDLGRRIFLEGWVRRWGGQPVEAPWAAPLPSEIRWVFLSASSSEEEISAVRELCERADPPPRVFWRCKPSRANVPPPVPGATPLIKPFAPHAFLSAARPHTATAPPQEATTPLSGRRVLLVEDTLINQEVALSFLKQLGIDAELATNGREALRLAAGGEPFDLIFMDIQMPEMDGFEATETLRSRELSLGLPRVPIIAMTAHALEGDRERCLARGMDDYIAKPFRLPELERALRRWLSGAGPAEAPRSARAAEAPGALATAEDFDPSRLESLRSATRARPEAFSKVLGDFLDRTPARIEEIQASVAAGDLQTAERAAHSLKSSCGMMGALRLARLAETIERLVAEGKLGQLEPLFAETGGAFDAARDQIDALTAALEL